MGLTDWFRTFCGNIQVQNGAAISSRYKAITKRLNTDFWETDSDMSHSLQVGSYGRNTAIHGTSDVDMIFQLPSSVYKQYDDYRGNGQSALLQAVRNSVKKTYSATNIGAQKHRQAAANLWLVREKYLALVTDLRVGKESLEKITNRRDALLEDLHGVYLGAPSTTYQAYKKAQEALQQYDEMTFSDAEIDALLPSDLRKSATPVLETTDNAGDGSPNPANKL